MPGTSFGGGRDGVVAITVPDYSVTTHCDGAACEAHTERLEAYDRAVREEASAAETRLVDVVAISGDVADDASLVSDDGLHPAPGQHARWLEAIYSVARSVLSD